MKRSDFYYQLPEQLIASYPLPNRSDSRLMLLNQHQGALAHHYFYELPEWLNPGDLVVLNNTKVIPARLYGQKATGGQVELLIERIVDDHTAWAHIRASRPPKLGTSLTLNGRTHFQMTDVKGGLYAVQSRHMPIREVLEQHGHMPLPPYMAREANEADKTRYQTRFARYEGSVAAPTAGLHFDERVFQGLSDHGVEVDYLTLHVGAGTFQPVRSEDVTDHVMHEEHLDVPSSLCERIRQTKANGHRVIAVGTTCVRALESAANQDNIIEPFSGATDLFIYPQYDFKVVDGIVTNFHLPESSLIMLVCAFGGYEAVMNAYKTAIQNHYRFYSYGDAMLVI